MSSRTKYWARRALLVGLVVLAAEQTWRHGHDYVFPEKFAEVEPGKIYRGAWQQDWPMRRLIRQYHIKTIVALAHQPDDPLALKEKALADELGVRWVHIPIVEDRLDDGQKVTVADNLEKAAAVLNDPASQPVFFHCHHGINRASLVHMAYRMIYCGYDLDRATAEIEESFGLVKVRHNGINGVDYRFMPTFYKERVMPKLQARAAAGDGSEVR